MDTDKRKVLGKY